jgi:hypothetical protein
LTISGDYIKNKVTLVPAETDIAYTVSVVLPDGRLAAEWLQWLRTRHIADVLQGGAMRAEIVVLDAPPHAYEIRYRFESREAFDKYEREHAPRLRAEGLQLFPVEKGVKYCRSLGVISDSFARSE